MGDKLPTYILFENATAVARFPELDFAYKASHPSITKVFKLHNLKIQIAVN